MGTSGGVIGTFEVTAPSTHTPAEFMAAVESTLEAAITDGSFTTALDDAATAMSYSGAIDFSTVTVDSISTSTVAPTAAPIVKLSGATRSWPSLGLVAACAAVIAATRV